MSSSSSSSTKLLDEYLSLISNVNPNTAKVHPIDPASITDKDTLIVVDMQHDFLPGGSFGVAEGDSILDSTAQLIHQFASKNATVIATRDYHPINHCSFNTHGGPFPPHCVQGSRGSFLHEKIGEALQKYVESSFNNDQQKQNKKKTDNVHVVFKAFSSGIDSFGAFQYSEEYAKDRVSSSSSSSCHCSVDWTGGYYLFSSNQQNDINAPPDVMSVLDKKPLKDLLSSGGRMFVCGLAMDFCVIDTAVNYAFYRRQQQQKEQQQKEQKEEEESPIFMIAPQTRAAHIPGVGKFGSGFLTNPEDMVDKMNKNGISFASL